MAGSGPHPIMFDELSTGTGKVAAKSSYSRLIRERIANGLIVLATRHGVRQTEGPFITSLQGRQRRSGS